MYNIRSAISACTNGRYGANCKENCTCELGNTEVCNPENGACTCKPGWQGNDCSLDVNECSNTETYFCPEHSSCINTEGAYRCICDIGFIKSGSACLGMTILLYLHIANIL